MEISQVEEILNQALDLEELHVKSGDGSHFEIIAVSEAFSELSRVKKQQTVYKPLAEKIADGSIHAVSIKTYTPDDWQRQRKLMSL